MEPDKHGYSAHTAGLSRLNLAFCIWILMMLLPALVQAKWIFEKLGTLSDSQYTITDSEGLALYSLQFLDDWVLSFYTPPPSTPSEANQPAILPEAIDVANLHQTQMATTFLSIASTSTGDLSIEPVDQFLTIIVTALAYVHLQTVSQNSAITFSETMSAYRFNGACFTVASPYVALYLFSDPNDNLPAISVHFYKREGKLHLQIRIGSTTLNWVIRLPDQEETELVLSGNDNDREDEDDDEGSSGPASGGSASGCCGNFFAWLCGGGSSSGTRTESSTSLYGATGHTTKALVNPAINYTLQLYSLAVVLEAAAKAHEPSRRTHLP